MLPYDPRRLAAIRDFPDWRKAIENALTVLDNRVAAPSGTAPAARMASFSAPVATGTGEGVLWLGAGLPDGLLACDGTTVAVDDYPALYDVLGDAYATGDEPPGHFRLPDLPPPPAGLYAVRT